MSGSGGFYKYRCKYFYSHNCTNWVWVNNAPCASCLAEGRDEEHKQSSSWPLSRDIVAPRVRDGILQYMLMELVAPTEPGHNWTLQDKAQPAPPAVPVTTSVSEPVGGAVGRFEISKTAIDSF
ncbi:hypothetical protein V2G26_016005 [Clonostachys chloroleuca]|uniref:Uncharacterized protein n=1 Tax=Clonostachys chloroleuca TaxID=1926264 RepID=A0AA35Q927_9HYPO|nr:unnamed protein product [Clonostachys chloroleuca]